MKNVKKLFLNYSLNFVVKHGHVFMRCTLLQFQIYFHQCQCAVVFITAQKSRKKNSMPVYVFLPNEQGKPKY